MGLGVQRLSLKASAPYIYHLVTCGRYVSKEEAAWESYFRLTRHNPLSNFESYNVAPTQQAPVVVQADGIRTMEPHALGADPELGARPPRSATSASMQGQRPLGQGRPFALPSRHAAA
jgi:putative SOS response-associated peptidase YedK